MVFHHPFLDSQQSELALQKVLLLRFCHLLFDLDATRFHRSKVNLFDGDRLLHEDHHPVCTDAKGALSNGEDTLTIVRLDPQGCCIERGEERRVTGHHGEFPFHAMCCYQCRLPIKESSFR
jgi:hypothetical protein